MGRGSERPEGQWVRGQTSEGADGLRGQQGQQPRGQGEIPGDGGHGTARQAMAVGWRGPARGFRRWWAWKRWDV